MTVPALHAHSSRLRAALAASLLALLCACGGRQSVPPEPSLNQALAGSQNKELSITASQTNFTYRLNIYLPADYDKTTDRLPVIYLLDGGPDNGIFNPLSHITEGLGVRAIIVGVGGVARRETDFRYPGLNPYYAFLTTELLPMVEAKYRIDPGQRTLAGHSFGGLFVGAAMLLDRANGHTFTNFIVMDMATHGQDGSLADDERKMFTATGGKLPDTTLVLSGDSFGNYRDADSFDRLLSARSYQGLLKHHIPTTSYGHVEMINPAFKESLRLIFNK